MHTPELHLSLQDNEWPLTYTDHTRQIVRAIVFDDEGWFHFSQITRNDEFGNATLIETAGGGVEEGEDPPTALARELREELGAEVEILCKIGVVEDYYNLIHRRNINHYYLCRALSFGPRQLTEQERENFHLSAVKLSYEEAVRSYETACASPIGRLLANRELPILRQAAGLLPCPSAPMHTATPSTFLCEE